MSIKKIYFTPGLLYNIHIAVHAFFTFPKDDGKTGTSSVKEVVVKQLWPSRKIYDDHDIPAVHEAAKAKEELVSKSQSGSFELHLGSSIIESLGEEGVEMKMWRCERQRSYLSLFLYHE